MRRTQLVSKWSRTVRNPRLFWWSGFVVLRQLAVALIAINAYGQTAFLSSPRELLATDPRAFAQWLNTNRPEPVSAQHKARMLSMLPAEGEVINLDDSVRRKLAGLSQLLQRTERDSVYEIKVIDVSFERVALYERTAILISETVFTSLDAEELQALVAHEIGHEYVGVDYEHASAREDHRRLKDLELLCDAIAIVTLYGLDMDPSRLIAGIEKITRYNRRLFEAAVDESNYPNLSERRQFARAVIAWVARASPQRSSR
jgi:hypothetical protein